MPIDHYYGPQVWTAGTFSVATNDSGDGNYPDTQYRERVQTRDALGPAGERILDTYQASPNYALGAHTEVNFGPSSGYWDSRGDGNGVYYVGDFYFGTDVESDNGNFSVPFAVGAYRTTPSVGFVEVFSIRVALTEGLMYCSMNGVEVGTGFGSLSADDAWHTIEALVLPGDGLMPHTEAVVTIWLDGIQIYDDTTSSLFVPSFGGNPAYGINYLSYGRYGLMPVTNFEIYTGDDDEPIVVPPMQRAGYVLFSNDVVEKQTETRFTKTYLQMLVADPPNFVAPDILTLTEVVGDLYDQEGNTIVTGRLHITPRGFLVVDGHLIAAKTVLYDITGPISLNLAASNGTLYDVRYDPDPDDTVTPINLKPGYFVDVWDIPEAASVDISDL